MTTHYHVIGMCREHGPVDLDIVDSEADGLQMIHEQLPTIYGKGTPVVVSDVYHSPNLVEFMATFPTGETHYLVGFLRVCQEDMNVCELLHRIESATKIVQMMSDPGPAGDLIRNMTQNLVDGVSPNDGLPSLEDTSVNFDSIEAFLKAQQQEGDDATH